MFYKFEITYTDGKRAAFICGEGSLEESLDAMCEKREEITLFTLRRLD